ncbi:MAG: hypothetical protein NTV86_06030 [Planctomycetota bacterium]|nr:hypothetical protein [Planctomycetota bacterium]
MIFYKARNIETGNMWDTWAFFHAGVYHMYYLANSGDKGWDNISMASSPDGVYWQERGPILKRRATSIWMGTGSAWKSPHFERDGRFLMNFSASEGPTRRQTIFFAESRDLVHWTRLGDECEFVQDERWYEPEGRWDCIFTLPRGQGGLYGYWTATPKAGGVFGFGQSADGLTWEALPPPAVEGAPALGEVGAVTVFGGRYYMLYGTGGSYIMLTLIADRPEGPFGPAKKNFQLHSGHTYFCRFIDTPDGTLINHHAMARDGQVYGAPFKRAHVDAEGTLRMTWWPGNEKLKHSPVPIVAPTGRGAVSLIETTFDVAAGVVLEGTLTLPQAGGGAMAGLMIECVGGEAIAVVAASDGTARIGPIRPDGTEFRPDKQVSRDIRFPERATFRLLLEHSLVEFYVEDVLMESYSLPAGATGRVGVLGEAASLRAWHARG